MKDFEFKYVSGLEDKSTPVQLDGFEKASHRGLKDRYIFDFSGNITEISASEPNSGNLRSRHYGWTNLAHWDSETWDFANGAPGAAQIVYKNLVAVDSDGSSGKPNPTRINSILGSDYQTPYWENNAIIYLDQRMVGQYGDSAASNYFRYFRSGYLELSIKTDKQNCVIAYGSANATSGGFVETTGQNATSGSPVFIDNNIAVVDEIYSDLNEIKVSIKNGKLNLEYTDNYGNNAGSFSIVGNKNIADNEWHHVVVNFGKPGTLRTHANKFNKKFIEFWVDGNIDIRDYTIDQKQIFFPVFEWLLGNPSLTFNKNFYGEESDFLSNDLNSISGELSGPSRLIGNNEFNLITSAIFNPIGDASLFSGSIHHYVFGVNTSLSKFEIEQRNRLYRNYEKNKVSLLTASALIVNPIVTTNKKKALKLFWNNLINDKAKNGIELDNNFDINSYSITHKILNSSTEVNNIDLANKKTLVSLPDVRIAITENIMLWGPGKSLVEDTDEMATNQIGNGVQWNATSPRNLDGFYLPNVTQSARDITQKYITEIISAAFIDMTFSGVDLKSGDRILLTNQFNSKHNGIYVFKGYGELLERPSDSSSPEQINNSVVRVTDGYYKDTTWTLKSNISSLSESQEWTQLEYHPNSDNFNSQPIFGSRWSQNGNKERFIDLQQDLNINQYDLIVFMNYPSDNNEIKEHFVGYDDFEIKVMYDNFIKSLQNVCANGASLYVSSPKLAQDLGIIKSYELIEQMLETSDAQSAAISPFEINEPADQYFDTHRINQYELQTEVAGLTNKATYILTDFINYVPSNINEPHQYHAKYAYRQLGLKEGNQFFIPSLSLLKITENENLPGFNQNRKGTKPLAVVEPNQINAGTIVTKLQNTYYQNGQVVTNPHDDDATTIIVHNGQILNGQPITGKIFVNFVEDGYTMSRQEYNKAIIQVIPGQDVNETVATRAWQYSTTRLNRQPRQINVRELTEYGQTKPTNGGGGPLIQTASSASNGIIRSETDSGNINYQSDLYPSETEEIYEIQEIPVLSMTWLGLQWLAE